MSGPGNSSGVLRICGWTPAKGGEDKGKDWVENTLGWSVKLVERLRKPTPEEVVMSWAEEWAKEGKKVDWQKLLRPRGR